MIRRSAHQHNELRVLDMTTTAMSENRSSLLWSRVLGTTFAILTITTSLFAQAVSTGGKSAPADNGPANTDFRQAGTVQLVLDPQGFRSRVMDLDFSPDGTLLAAAGEKDIRLYDLQTGQQFKTLRGDQNANGAYGNINAALFSPDGRELIVGIDDSSDSGSIRVYDTSHWDELKEVVAGMNVSVRRLAISRDGRYLAAAGEDGNLYLWNWPARRIVKTIPAQRADQPIFDALMFPSREPVLLALAFNGPKLYSVPDGREFKSPQGLPGDVASWMGAVMGQQMNYPLGSGKTPPQIWDVTLDRGHWMVGGHSKPAGSPEYWAGVINNAGTSASTVYHDHKFTVSAVASSPVGNLAASADTFGEVHVWNRRTGQLQFRFQSLAQKFYEASFDSAGTRIAYGNTHHRGAEYKRNHFGPANFVFDLGKRTIGESSFVQGLTPQVERAHIGSYKVDLRMVDDAVQLVASDSGRETARYRLPAGTNPMCYTLLERHGFDIRNPVIYGDDRGVLACWDSNTDLLHRAFIGHSNFITSVGSSPDGKLLVSSSTDGEICVWPLTGRQPTGHPDFDRQADVIIKVKPGSSSDRAGIKVGDRIITLNGMSVTEWEERLIQGTYTDRPGQQVPVVVDRNGQRFTVQLTLGDGPDYVQPLLHLFVTADHEWILWTQQGYYDCSPSADRLIGWLRNRGPDKSAEFHTVQQFRKQLYRPDVIDKVIELGDVPAAIAAANQAQGRGTADVDLRDPEIFNRLHPPQVEFVSPAAGSIADQPQVKVTVRVASPNNLPVRDVTFLLDGNPAEVAHLNAGQAGQGVEVTADLTLTPGPHVIGIVASNGQTTSPVVTRKLSYRGGQQQTNKTPLPDSSDKTNLYVLAIGIAKYAHSGNGFNDLQFAARDATEFARLVELHRDGRIYGRIESKVITDADATRVNVLDGFDWLVHNCKQGDIAMIFISAHGIRDDLQNYYLATHDVQPDKLRATGVSWHEVTRTLHKDFPPCKRLLFLDTCHSGGVAQGQVIYDPVHDVVAPEVGTIVFASCMPREESQERGDWQHGAFTYAIMETLKDPSSDTFPLPGGDQQFSQSELKLGVVHRVKALTNGGQNPVLISPPTLREFNILQVLSD
ncbi:MAG: PDZ domain-containing protein [Planctomycetaceae bacterium]